MQIIQKLLVSVFLASIMPVALEASIDIKHRAEPTATTSAGSAGSAAASASIATAAMPIASDNKTALERAVDAHDIRWVRAHARKLSTEERTKVIRYAAQSQHPRMVLALVPKQSHESHEKGLRDCFFKIKDLTMPEYATYRNAFVESQNKRIQRVRDIHQEVLANTNLIPSIAMLVAQILHPTVAEIQRSKSGNKALVPIMHPELEIAIVDGDTKKFDELAAAGWLTDTPNNGGHDALALAVHHGQLEIVKKLVGQIPFVSEQRRNELKKVAESKNYTEIAQLITAAWPSKALDDALLSERKTGVFMQALAKGANPNHFVQFGDHTQPVAFIALLCELIYIKMLIDTKKVALNTKIKRDLGGTRPLLFGVVHDTRQPEHLRLLLDAGFDPNALADDGCHIIFIATASDDLALLKILLDKGADPYATIDPYVGAGQRMGKQIPLIVWAKGLSMQKRFKHIKEVQIKHIEEAQAQWAVRTKLAEEEYIYSCA